MTNNINLNSIDLWNIWDLHVHSPYSKDYFDRTCDETMIKLKSNTQYLIDENLENEWVNKLLTVIEKNDVKLISITDHNLFSKQLFQKLVKVKGGMRIEIIPGIEVDCILLDEKTQKPINKRTYFQLIIHSNPASYSKLEEFNKYFEDFSIKNKEKYKIKFSALTFIQVCNFFIQRNIECNISVEGSKSRGIFEKHREDFDKDNFEICNNVSRMFSLGHISAFNDSSIKNIIQTQNKMNKFLHDIYKEEKTGLKISSFWATDSHCVKCYPNNCENQEVQAEWSYFNGRNDYMGLKFALNSSYTKIKTGKPVFSNLENTISRIEINDKEIITSKRINIIIGPRSAGKSLLLAHISKAINNESYDNNTYNKKFLQKFTVKCHSHKDVEMTLASQKIAVSYKQGWFIDTALSNTSVLLDDMTEIKKYDILDANIKYLYDFYLLIDKLLISLQNIVNRTISPFENLNIILNSNNDDWRYNFQDNLYEILDVSKEIEEINKIDKFINKRLKELNNIKNMVNSFNEAIKKDISDYEEINKKFMNIKPIEIDLTVLNNNIINFSNLENDFKHRIKRLQLFEANQEQLKTNLKNFKNDAQLAKTKFNDKQKGIKKDFFELGENISKVKKMKSIKIESEYFDKDGSSTKANYTIEYKTVHKLKKDTLFKTLEGLIYQRYLPQNDLNTINVESTIDLLIKNILKHSDKTIFKIDAFDRKTMAHDSFRDKIFESNNKPDITQNGKSVLEDSPGSRAQILFELNLDRKKIKDNSIILLDQPEDSIDNVYIAHDMIRIIKDLSLDKQFFLVTHNPSLVINLEPDNIIIPFNENGSINYYNGRLEDTIIYNGGEVKIIELIAKFIEGGKKSLIKRIENYELGEIKHV